MKKIHFVLNGKLKQIDHIKNKIHKLFVSEFHINLFTTSEPGNAIILAKQAVINGTDYIIAVGGDGTISEVINGIMLVEKEKRKNLIVGLYPIGSGNDFSRTMKLSKKLNDLYDLIKQNNITTIDIGKLEYKKVNGEDDIRYFNNIADIGLGAEVVKRVNEDGKFFGPNFAFLKASILGFLHYKKKKLRIESDTFSWCGNLLILCLANGKYFGSGLCIAPHAEINDEKIALTLAGDVSLFDYVKNISKIRSGKFIKHPELYYRKLEMCSIEPVGEPCLIEADGEIIGKIPLKAVILKREISFLSPIL